MMLPAVDGRLCDTVHDLPCFPPTVARPLLQYNNNYTLYCNPVHLCNKYRYSFEKNSDTGVIIFPKPQSRIFSCAVSILHYHHNVHRTSGDTVCFKSDFTRQQHWHGPVVDNLYRTYEPALTISFRKREVELSSRVSDYAGCLEP